MSGVPWRRAIVVGASSGIGEAIARQLAADGVRVALVARRADRLATLAAALGGPSHALAVSHDVRDLAGVPQAVAHADTAVGGADLVVLAAGITTTPGVTASAPDENADVVRTNLLGTMAWLDAVLPRLIARGDGTVVVISSVAADRGRKGFPAYHASKAGLDVYVDALRHRHARDPVRIVTVKPGPVDTPLSRGLARRPLLISAERCARETLRAARGGRLVQYVPWIWRPIMWAIRAIPGPIFRRLDI